MSEIKPVSIKTANERMPKDNPFDPFTLLNCFGREVIELRAALEALQQDNGLLKSCEIALEKAHAESAAQAKRIAELEAELQTIKAWIHNPVGESTLDNLSAQKGTE
jgi:hypothetical protein